MLCTNCKIRTANADAIYFSIDGEYKIVCNVCDDLIKNDKEKNDCLHKYARPDECGHITCWDCHTYLGKDEVNLKQVFA